MKLRKKMSSKKQNKTIIKKCDRLWSLIVRSAGECLVCGKPGTERADGLKVKGLDAHHLISRRYPKYRYDVHNGVCLCKGCHMFKVHGGRLEVVWAFFVYLRLHHNTTYRWFTRHYDKLDEPDVLDYEQIYKNLSDDLAGTVLGQKG
ncbi:MAG: hypothetical protein GY841_16510 [FCB group bacterium]|nr:hypothetical protein [FCB group bacterium]